MANEKLIRLSDAIGWLRTASEVYPGDIDSHGMRVFDNLKATMIESLGYCQAVDAVEVVRCKDCKWRNTMGCPYKRFYSEERDDLDYCSDGERKSDHG